MSDLEEYGPGYFGRGYIAALKRAWEQEQKRAARIAAKPDAETLKERARAAARKSYARRRARERFIKDTIINSTSRGNT